MRKRAFIATTGNGLARAEEGTDGSWTVEHLLAGQRVSCLAADPHERETVYAGTEGEGLLRSDDWGKTWRAAGLVGQVVKAVAASSAEPGMVYAGTRPPGLHITRDGGANWHELVSFRRIPSRRFWFSPAESPFTAYVQGIALSPTDPNVIAVGIEAGAVVRSTDGGLTWTDHRRGALRDCHSLTFHSTNGDWAYEGGGSGAGAALSRDGGATWTQPRKGLDRHYGWAVAADPARPEVWFVSVSPGPFKAHGANSAEAYIFRAAGGAVWQKLRGGLPQPLDHMPYALLTDPGAPGRLCAGLSNGDVWHSGDYGENWERLPFSLGGIHRTLIMVQTS